MGQRNQTRARGTFFGSGRLSQAAPGCLLVVVLSAACLACDSLTVLRGSAYYTIADSGQNGSVVITSGGGLARGTAPAAGVEVSVAYVATDSMGGKDGNAFVQGFLERRNPRTLRYQASTTTDKDGCFSLPLRVPPSGAGLVILRVADRRTGERLYHVVYHESSDPAVLLLLPRPTSMAADMRKNGKEDWPFLRACSD